MSDQEGDVDLVECKNCGAYLSVHVRPLKCEDCDMQICTLCGRKIKKHIVCCLECEAEREMEGLGR